MFLSFHDTFDNNFIFFGKIKQNIYNILIIKLTFLHFFSKIFFIVIQRKEIKKSLTFNASLKVKEQTRPLSFYKKSFTSLLIFSFEETFRKKFNGFSDKSSILLKFCLSYL